MIFTCVGTQLPFTRLMGWLDQWANGNNVEVISQIGPDSTNYSSMATYDFLEPSDFEELFKSASCIVSHAGMGSIISALKYSKPIIIVPRLASLGEHRNEHQLSTLKSFSNTPGIYTAQSQEELVSLLDEYRNLKAGACSDSLEYISLIENLRQYL